MLKYLSDNDSINEKINKKNIIFFYVKLATESRLNVIVQ